MDGGTGWGLTRLTTLLIPAPSGRLANEGNDMKTGHYYQAGSNLNHYEALKHCQARVISYTQSEDRTSAQD